MARFKRSQRQTSFRFMEVREDLLEADDSDLRQASLWSAQNMRGRSTGTLSARPGLVYQREADDADSLIEIRPATGVKFGLLIRNSRMDVIDSRARIVHTVYSPPWTARTDVWIESFQDSTIVGGWFGLYELKYNWGTWSFERFSFEVAPGGELAQPYWAYEQDTTIRPSGSSGNITIEASQSIWTARHVGLRIRYLQREIEITGIVNSTTASGRVINDLPPTFNIVVQDASGFRIGEVIVGADSNYQGVIIGIDGTTVQAVTLEGFEGPTVGEKLSSPTSVSEVTSTEEVEPGPTTVWDEPLMSDLRGWPRSAAVASGRLLLLDFAQIPDLIALSSVRSIRDFDVGAADDDAIVRQVGNNTPRWLHAVNMSDVLLLADTGVYYIPIREVGVLTPSTFNTIFVDNTGSSEVKPVKVEDGVLFVDAGGDNISAALLDGNIYLKWSVRSMTEYHSHLIKRPRRLCGPSLTSSSVEKYVFVVNGDDTLAVISWQESIRDEQIGFAPWDTNGRFIGVDPAFDAYWAVVDRDIDGQTKRFLERFDDDVYVDCAALAEGESQFANLTMNGETLLVNGSPLSISTPVFAHLGGATVSIYANGWDLGDVDLTPEGFAPGGLNIPVSYQAGFNFVCDVKPWPVEAIDAGRAGTFPARIITAWASVQSTVRFKGVMNGFERSVGDYDFGDDLTQPPRPRTRVFRFAVYGNRDHPEIVFKKDRPGPFNVLATGQEVQA